MNPVPVSLPTPAAPRWLRATAWFARLAFGTLLMVWILLLASWGLLHGWIVPRISEFRPMVEEQATRALGVPVRIGRITAESVGWVPSFAVHDIGFHDTKDRPALSLGLVVVSLSPQSLMRLGFDQLYIDKPQLDIRRAPDGRITVAGLSTEGDGPQDDRAMEWLLDQKEVVIRNGSIRWTDEQRRAPPLVLTELDLLMRNSARRHAFRVDARLPADWGGEKFTAMAQFRQPLLSLQKSEWRAWDGRIYASAAGVDVAQLRKYMDFGQQLTQGRGALRAWVDVKKGELVSGTVDMALAEVSASLGQGLEPLTLHSITGRMGLTPLDGGFEFSANGLQFLTSDGRHWPGGSMRLRWLDATIRQNAKAELHADRLDLQALAQIGTQLPLEPRIHAALRTYAPSGMIEMLDARWEAAPLTGGRPKFSVKGRAHNLHIDAGQLPTLPQTDTEVSHALGTPGVHGAEVDFDLNQSGGKGRISIQSGSLTFPGVFAEPVVPMDKLSADLQWTVTSASMGKAGAKPGAKVDEESADHIHVQLQRLSFSNQDAEGEAQGSWRTSDGSRNSSRFPGVLDLQGSLSRGEAVQTHRYLPLVIPVVARDYVRNAIQQGRVSGARFKLKGDLYDMPFSDPKKGEFRISASFKNGSFAYVPSQMTGTGAPQWPALTQLAGELVVDRTSLVVKGVTGKIDGLAGAQIIRGEGLIANLGANLAVQVSVDARGPVTDGLAFVTRSPINGWTGQALAKASATGNADYRVRLNLPIAEIEKSKVQGTVTLANSDVQISPEIPAFSRVRGQVLFSETGFNLQGIQSVFLGGDLRAEGGTVRSLGAAMGPQKAETSILIKGQGTVTAEGLRQATELGLVSRLAHSASGSAAYTASVGIRRGVTEISVISNLQGLALNLPPPLNKSAEVALPLRFENALLPNGAGVPATRLHDQLLVDLGRVGSVQFVRDLAGTEPRVLRGGIGVGLLDGENIPMMDDGVAANIRLQTVDLDAWDAAISRAAGAKINPTADSGSGATPAAMAYLPTVIALRAKELQFGGHSLHDVVSGGGREGINWRANLDSSELSGYVDYRQSQGGNPGRVYARLSRLNIPASAQNEVEALLDEQPATIPALDIVVENMELRGKRLGRVEIEAINRSQGVALGDSVNSGVREWRLNKFNVIVPEAKFSAVGNWTALGVSKTAGELPVERSGRSLPEQRRTALNYTLDIANAGELLTRLGMKDVVGQGHGKLAGQLAWIGSPLALDYPSLGGQFNVDLETGQFLKVPLGGGAKLLGVLSLQSLPRRLALDFRDVFSEGFSFDFLRGDVHIEQGIAVTNNLQMKGVSAAVLMEGKADIAKETQDLKVVVVPEINAGTASLVAGVINPVIGLTTFLTQMILRQPLISAATREFHIDGTWSDPKITPVERKAGEPSK
ncbi:MAG: TIGR02099 family protein [Burkholderiaceae bacterium]|nr:TIGR02099 family protein [Burkholderiaceae bacterium]